MGEPKDYAALYGDRALDAEVAEVVLGLRLPERPTFGERQPLILRQDGTSRGQLPHYATDRNDAMDVFFAAVERFGHAEIRCDMEDYGREPGDIVTVILGNVNGNEDDVYWSKVGLFAPTVCRLMLAAVRWEERHR